MKIRSSELRRLIREVVSGDDPLLDAAYEGSGLEPSEISRMGAKRGEVVELLRTVGVSESAWSEWLKFQSMQFFGTARSKGQVGDDRYGYE